MSLGIVEAYSPSRSANLDFEASEAFRSGCLVDKAVVDPYFVLAFLYHRSFLVDSLEVAGISTKEDGKLNGKTSLIRRS